jgi:hypothetical protein
MPAFTSGYDYTSPLTRRSTFLAVVAAVLAATLAITQLPSLAQTATDEPLPTVVFIARADNPVDALAAGAVAGTMGAQVLLTRTSQLEDATLAALVALDPDLVVLAGGNAALSPAVEQAIAAIPYPVRRVSGATRVETAARLSELAAELGFGRPLLTDATVQGDAGLAGTLSASRVEGAPQVLTFDAQEQHVSDGVLGTFPAMLPAVSLDVTVPEDGTLLVTYAMSVLANDTTPVLVDLQLDSCEDFTFRNTTTGATVTSEARAANLVGSVRLELPAGEHTLHVCGTTSESDPTVLNAHITGVFEPGGTTDSTISSVTAGSADLSDLMDFGE